MEKLFLGKGVEISTDSLQTGLNNNIIVVGPSGSGKTMSYAEMCLLHTNTSSMIVTLSKRRLAVKYMDVLAAKGYRVFDLNLVEPLKSTVAFDPLHYVHSQTDITFLARSIVMANPKKATTIVADPFWDDAAMSLLSALIAYIFHTKTKPAWSGVMALFSQLKVEEKGDSITTSLDTVFDRISRDPAAGFAWQCWKTFRYAPMRTAGSIYSTLSVTLDTMFTPELMQSMKNNPQMEITGLGCERSILFLTTSAVNPALNAYAGLFYATAVKELFEFAEDLPSGRLAVPVHLLCDDFAVGAQIPSFAYYISVFREKGISTSILLQSESQLTAMYGSADATTIINNCDRYIYLGGSDLVTCRNMAERVGRPLSDILYLPLGDEIVLQRGSRPVFTKRYAILEDDAYANLTNQTNQTNQTNGGCAAEQESGLMRNA